LKNSPKKSSPPPTLSKEARARWQELVAEYGISDAAGLQILHTAMEAFDRMRGAQAQIAKDGQTHLDRFGQMKSHPLLPVERDARAAMLAALKALNLDVEPVHVHGPAWRTVNCRRNGSGAFAGSSTRHCRTCRFRS
jgi:P27 family predicted phage terminase small subunit